MFNVKIKVWYLVCFFTILLYFVYSPRYTYYIYQIGQIFLNFLYDHSFVNIEYIQRAEKILQQLFSTDPDHKMDFQGDFRIPQNYKLETGSGISSHAVNIIPFLSTLDNIVNLEYWKILFGSGAGSTSFYYNQMTTNLSVANPHSMLVKYLYNYGFGGLFIFSFALYNIINKRIIVLDIKKKKIILGAFIMILFANIAHISDIIYLFITLIILYCANEKKQLTKT